MDTLQVPTLDSLQSLPVVAATFAAFKPEDKVSFVRQYDPKVQAIEGFRHCVIRWRQTDKNTAAKPAQMVTVPVISGLDKFAVFTDGEPGASLGKMLLNLLEDEQDSMIRAFIDQQVSNIHWDNITLEKVIESYNAARVSTRLTKEQIEAWFNVACKDVCEQRAKQISEAKGYDAEQTKKQIAGTMNAYREIACKLAAPVPNLGTEQATALKNLFAVAKLDDDMSKALNNKLHAILNPKVIESGDL